MNITPIIGLEVHVELKTRSKMFCGCDATHFQVEPNTHTCPVCLGLPGALPVPNKTAIEWCIKLGLALNCQINTHSFFERKNYFYPDLAKGYQISQYQQPFCINGYITVNDAKIRINRVHQEEDTAKSQHQVLDGEDVTLLDFNRSGVPLVEIVSEPDLTSSQQAKSYLNKIQQIVRYIGVSDADIEKGSMRCEPTVNLCIDDKFYTPLVEIKNVASLTGVMNAIEFEVKRQTDEFLQNKITKSPTNKTTRGWDADKNQTFLQREKEGSADYRYFPEPDIPPLEFSTTEIEAIRATLPELPDAKIERYKKEFGLSDYGANLIAVDKNTAEIFEYGIKLFSDKSSIKKIANIFLSGFQNENLDINKVNPNHWLEVGKMLEDNSLSSTTAKIVFVKSYQTEENPKFIAQKENLLQVSDTTEIEKIAQEVITANPKAVADYKNNPNSIGFLVGKLMKASGSKANPQLAGQILTKLLQ